MKVKELIEKLQKYPDDLYLNISEVENLFLKINPLNPQDFKIYFADIANLNISVRSYNALRNDGILIIGHLVATSEHEIIKLANLGKKSLGEIKKALNEIGLSLGTKLPKNLMHSLGIERTGDYKRWDGKDCWNIKKINN